MRLILVLCWSLVFVVNIHAQTGSHIISIENVILEQNGNISSNPVHDRKYMDLAFDTDKNRFYLLIDRALYEIDPHRREVSFLDSLPLPPDVTMIEYSPFHKGLLIWDRGVGRVFLRDSVGNVTRIDNSFEHKNQFGHGSWVDPLDGKLYAFGGYGLFTTKSIITRFSPKTKEWELFPAMNEFFGPIAQMHAHVFTDFNRRRIYLRGNADRISDMGNELSQIQLLNAIWRFTLDTRIWSRIAILDEITVSGASPLVPNSLTHNSVHPEHPLLLVMSYSQLNQQDLIGVDLDTGKHRFLSELNPALTLTFPILGTFWSDVDQSFYVLSFRVMSTQNRMDIDLKRIYVHDYPALLDWINESDLGVNPWAYIFVLAFMLIPGVWIGRRWFKSGESQPLVVTNEHIEGVSVMRGTDGQLILRSPTAETDEIPPMESKLLETLLAQILHTGVYVKSDDIDNILLPDHPSPDYIRRNRNLTLERLEALLQSMYELPDDKYILRRQNRVDKRKNEYRLNEKYIRG